MAADANLIASCRDTVEVVYGHFYIQDKGVSWFHDSSQPEPGPPEDDDLVRTALDWISIVSAVGDHVAGAQLEVWDREPQRQDDWEVSADFEFTCTTGNVALVAVMMGPSTEELIIGAPGAYRGRVYSRGREDAEAALETADEVPEGTEQYLVQWWQG
ncbi:hypothetical protein MXD62_16945 [Frankia sp. Mgl5]|uniref:hypothetical protein n=1 Tax=Frankia sp. Mgl5 TaxID=2933793 RepID=UPI00200D6450|nr:hypothetical protein [Frankia sp. Mgl5]MCK9928845.1 hypothetical protein [Frankia sp. Mgl5]